MWTKEKTIAVIVAAAIIVVAAVFILLANNNGKNAGTGTAGSTNASSGAVAAPESSATRAPVPQNVVVPNEGDVAAPANVAVPDVQAAAHPAGGNSSYRQFAISMDKDTFSPSTVAVHKGDIVDLEITSVDKAYSFTQPDYGFNTPIPLGSTQKIQFQALNDGKFTFYCSSCGGPASGPIGYLIVTDN